MIRVRDLGYEYADSGTRALRGVSLDVEPGEVFGLLGPSGAGKSTTQRVLIGLLDDYEGSARVFGREVAEWGPELYERVGVAGERPNLYHKLTGRENLELFGSLYGGAVRDPAELLESVGMADAIDRRVGAYSKGMRMRCSFVRALLHDPDLVFLDEPTAGIDPNNARSVEAAIEDAAADGTTVFLTTHDMAVADRLCDRVAFVVDGRVPVVDAPRALKLRHGEPTVRIEFRGEDGPERRRVSIAALGEDEGVRELLRSGRVESVHSEEATLEDVFAEVTGADLT